MRLELDETLCTRYPSIFAERHGDPATTAMCWGLEIGDGWYTLVDVLCRELQRQTDEEGAPQVVAFQVKQKGGELRFHVGAASERQIAMIDFAQAMSRQLCEGCGAPGTVSGGRLGQASVKCPACRASGTS